MPPKSPAEAAIVLTISGQIAASASRRRSSNSTWTGHHWRQRQLPQQALGYSLDEIKGKHHSMFVEEGNGMLGVPRILAKLNRGETRRGNTNASARAERGLDSGSYNPIFDLNGKPFKVVKYAMPTSHNR